MVGILWFEPTQIENFNDSKKYGVPFELSYVCSLHYTYYILYDVYRYFKIVYDENSS